MILEIQQFWNELEKKKIKAIVERFQIANSTAKRYIYMSESEIKSLDSPHNYPKRETPMNKWLNIIYKMMRDGHSNETIYYYIYEQPDFKENEELLVKYIYLIGKNNFPNRAPFNPVCLMEQVLPPEVISFKRTEILKYILTCNPKKQKNKELEKYIGLIKETYPIVPYVETIYKEFHGIIMGNSPEKIDSFITQYEESNLSAFCNGIKKDIVPVKNAITYPESSGFVEGNNNKLKLIKRIVYGRSSLVNFRKKCQLAFLPKNEDFSLATFI